MPCFRLPGKPARLPCAKGFLVLVLPACLAAQPSESASGLTFYASFHGSGSTLGLITRADPNVGYNFNRYFGIDAGLPFYIIRASDRSTALFGSRPETGLGNFYTNLRFSLPNPVVNYMSIVLVTAPTGDENKGLSTGRVTWDWNHHIHRNFDRLTPFANLGVANAISDTPLFTRPFMSFGMVSHYEGGAHFRLARLASVGGSAYAYEPWGEQTVISRVMRPELPPVAARNAGRGRRRGVFETAPETVGPANIARDRGFSFWLDLFPAQAAFLEVGYSRSTPYALDSVFFGIGINVKSIVRNARRQ